MNRFNKHLKIIGVVLLIAMVICYLWTYVVENQDKLQIIHVSYDPTRELFEEYNAYFQKYYQQKKGVEIEVIQSHGGSGKQARSVIEGVYADVVSLALERDISQIEQAGLINKGWKNEFKDNSAPFTSTIVFLVRKGNEKKINDWNDLISKDVEVITPNPKTSGGARWNFLAAWAYAIDNDKSEEKAKEFVKKLYKQVKVLDTGARAATTTFVENRQGDVLITWENEAFLTLEENPGEYEIVTPSITMLAQPMVAVVDEVVEEKKTSEVAKEYIEGLYSVKGQEIAAKHYYRPTNTGVLKEYKDFFDLSMKEVTIDELGGWKNVHENFFQDEGIFDQIYLEE